EIDFTLSEYSASSARLIESMNNFLTVYATLNSSLTFLIADMTILSLIYNGGTQLIFQLTIMSVMILGNVTLVMYIIYRPETYMQYNKFDKSLIALLMLTGITISVIFTSYLYILLLGIIFVIVGLRYRLYENRINRIERYFILFIRYFSQNYFIVNNLRDSLMAVLRGDLGDIRPLIRRALNRLLMGINKKIIFELMGMESKSVLVSMLSKALYETINMGGNVLTVGEVI
ncbi:flagellar protein FlaJ, partial [Sulfolobus sp. D5]